MHGQAKSSTRRAASPPVVSARRDRLLEELEHVFLRDGFLHFRTEGLERLIESGTAQGHFRGVHAKLIAEVMLNAVAQLVDPEVLARVGLTMSQAFAELYDIVEHAIEARSAKITARDRSVKRIRRRG